MKNDIVTWGGEMVPCPNVSVHFKGRETLAVISNTDGIFIGTANCRKDDKYSREIGTNIAVTRAVQTAAKFLEKTWLERSVSKVDYRAKHPKRKSANA